MRPRQFLLVVSMVGILFISVRGFAFHDKDKKDKGDKKENAISKLKSEPPAHQTELQMLETARAGVSQAAPALRAHACWQASMGYAVIDRVKAASGLKSCFADSVSVEVDPALKSSLQFKILDALFAADRGAALDLSAMAEPQARTAIRTRVLEQLVNDKRYDAAISMINELFYTGEFPYKAAATLMLKLPKERDQDRRLVFTAALSSYRRREEPPDPHVEDMGTLVVRFWRHLPPQLVMQAIDELLDHAKKDSEDKNSPSLTVGTGIGEAQFTTSYQFRLFELVPIIQEVDPSRAESILRDNPRLAGVLKDYPDGLQSLEPTYNDKPLKSGEFPKFGITHRMNGASSGPDPMDFLREKANREATEIADGWAKDPVEALRKASELPEIGIEQALGSAKADAFSRIAASALATRPDIAGQAVKGLLKMIADYPLIVQSRYLLFAAAINFKLKDNVTANELVAKAFSLGTQLYEADTNHDKPNKAFKFDWPSAGVWRASVILQEKFDSNISIDLVKQIKDPEIQASVQITLANTRLGVPAPANVIKQQFEKGTGSVQNLITPY
jgi:hypothetical protein